MAQMTALTLLRSVTAAQLITFLPDAVDQWLPAAKKLPFGKHRLITARRRWSFLFTMPFSALLVNPCVPSPAPNRVNVKVLFGVQHVVLAHSQWRLNCARR